MTQVPFDIEGIFKIDWSILAKGCYFNPMEILSGGCIAEIYFQNKQACNKLLRGGKLEVFSPYLKPIQFQSRDQAYLDYRYISPIAKSILLSPSSTTG